MSVGKRIEKWRADRGLTQREAANGAGISQAAWHAIESGTMKRIGLQIARHVVAYMGGEITLDDLGEKGRLPEAAESGPLPKPARKRVRSSSVARSA